MWWGIALPSSCSSRCRSAAFCNQHTALCMLWGIHHSEGNHPLPELLLSYFQQWGIVLSATALPSANWNREASATLPFACGEALLCLLATAAVTALPPSATSPPPSAHSEASPCLPWQVAHITSASLLPCQLLAGRTKPAPSSASPK